MSRTPDDDNRLTDADRTRISTRVRRYLEAQPTHRSIMVEAAVAAERLAWHAIGCDARDLHDSELDEIATILAHHIADANRTRPPHPSP